MYLKPEVPPHLQPERRAVEADIREAFRGVSRAGGFSWSGAVVADHCGSREEIMAAAKNDTEESWEQLVDDPSWNPEPGIGGFCFLEAIGFRYYLAPAMVRCLRSGFDEGIGFHLTLKPAASRMNDPRWSKLDNPQQRSIVRFLRYMTALSEANEGMGLNAEGWTEALNTYWKLVE